jgi:hypothetical protein
MIELIYTSNKITGLTPAYDWFMLYANSPDALIICNNTYLYKVFRDGTTCFIGRVSDCKAISLNEGRIGWYDNIPSRSTYQRFLLSDEFAFQPHFMEIINPDWLFPSAYGSDKSYIDLNKRLWIGWSSGYPKLLNCINIDSGEVIWTVDLVPLGTSYLPIHYLSKDYVIVVGIGDTAYIVNIDTGVLKDTFQIPVCWGNAYDFNHGLFITIESDQKVRVYLADRYPASFSAVISEYGVLQAYRGCDIKVRLLSSNNLPCPDRLVTWELPNSLGALEKVVSETDIDGYAWNYYYGPTVAGGTEKIKVSWG